MISLTAGEELDWPYRGWDTSIANCSAKAQGSKIAYAARCGDPESPSGNFADAFRDWNLARIPSNWLVGCEWTLPTGSSYRKYPHRE